MDHPASPATPPSLDRQNEALSQRMRNDICFFCKKQGHWKINCPDRSPAGSQPSAATLPSLDRQDEALPQGMRNDTCFSCKKQGHWTKYCPDKSQPSAAASSSSTGAADVPVLQCRCGAGACAIVTSHSQHNRDRKFYNCPNRTVNGVGGCGFFAWCDKYSAPMCPCGAGRCRINFSEDPPHKGREYFSCRIKKGHGACKFFQWADAPAENVASRDVATSVVAPMADDGENYEEGPLSTMDSGDIQEVICRLSERHSVTSGTYAACDRRIKSLREDYRHAKETLLRIESELQGCEVEHAELQGRLAEITREMEEAKSSMEEASRVASLAVQGRGTERCTARAAMEKARLHLQWLVPILTVGLCLLHHAFCTVYVCKN